MAHQSLQDQPIIFMGTPQFSVPVLDALIANGYKVCAVYSQPPRPAGRGQKLQKSPVHLRAEELGIPVYTPLSFKDPKDQEIFQSHQAVLAVVVAYGLILPKAILDAPARGCVNVHASLLPRWRGAAPINRAIEMGDAVTGITTMQMDIGLDTGPMLLKEEVVIHEAMTAGELHDVLSILGAKLLIQTLQQEPQPVPQPQEGITYAHKLSKSEALVDWTLDAAIIERRVRAFNPWPLMQFNFKGTDLKILKAHVVDGQGMPRELLNKNFTVACGSQALRLDWVQPAGKKAMGGADFLRGHASSLNRKETKAHA